MKKYNTIQGDMWDIISQKMYGNTQHIDVLIGANPEHRAVYIFSAGITLDIPEIEEKITADDLPPWKKAEG